MPANRNAKKSEKTLKPQKKAQTKVKEEKPVRPTVVVKHAKVLKKMSENVGAGNKPSVTAAAQEAGYSESYANSGRLQKTKSWKEMLNHYLPEDKLLKIHDQQLNSWKLNSMLFVKQVPDEVIYELMEGVNCVVKKLIEIPTGKLCLYICPDNQSRNKALEMGLKLYKKLTDKVEIKDTTPYTQLSDEELGKRIKEARKFFLKK